MLDKHAPVVSGGYYTSSCPLVQYRDSVCKTNSSKVGKEMA